MKLRTNFVSNSSSQSFIVAKDATFPTIWDVAIAMIACREWDRDKEDIKKAIVRRDSGEQCEMLTFPTCNFDTFIKDVGDEYWISTCNNHYEFIAVLSGHCRHCEKLDQYKGMDLGDYIEFYLEKEEGWEQL